MARTTEDAASELAVRAGESSSNDESVDVPGTRACTPGRGQMRVTLRVLHVHAALGGTVYGVRRRTDLPSVLGGPRMPALGHKPLLGRADDVAGAQERQGSDSSVQGGRRSTYRIKRYRTL